MPQPIIQVVRLDPYHEVWGPLVPMVALKLAKSLEDMPDLLHGVPVFMSALWANNPDVLLLAAINPATGEVKGFCSAYIDGHILNIVQPRLDEPSENDAVSEMILAAQDWGRERKATLAVLVSKKLIDSRWTKKHNFRPSRHISVKELA